MSSLLHARVHGAGPTGALTALALSAAGWDVCVLDPLDRERLLQRTRAYAFTQSSRQLLQRLDLWSALVPHLSPFRQLRLTDAGCDGMASFRADDLGPRLAGDPAAAVGWICEHRPLMGVLLERLRLQPRVQLLLGSPLGQEPSDSSPADLVVAADGPDSPTRRALGIGCWGWGYGQDCLTVQVELRGLADDAAWELLRPEGPFAVLPLGGRRFQLVWSAPTGRCQFRRNLPDAAFLDQLAGALPDPLEPDTLLVEPRSFPVGLALARRLHRGNTLLVGESAHRCHPVGGQGLNLCWRDVASLHRLAVRAARGRLDPRRIGAAYGRRRWPDLLVTLLATDLLVRIFSNRHPLLLPLRQLALASLARSAPLRRLVLGVMTHGISGPASAAAVPPAPLHGFRTTPPDGNGTSGDGRAGDAIRMGRW